MRYRVVMDVNSAALRGLALLGRLELREQVAYQHGGGVRSDHLKERMIVVVKTGEDVQNKILALERHPDVSQRVEERLHQMEVDVNSLGLKSAREYRLVKKKREDILF
jgi:hypothetical protein